MPAICCLRRLIRGVVWAPTEDIKDEGSERVVAKPGSVPWVRVVRRKSRATRNGDQVKEQQKKKTKSPKSGMPLRRHPVLS